MNEMNMGLLTCGHVLLLYKYKDIQGPGDARNGRGVSGSCEEDMISAAQRGDRDAFAWLYGRYVQQIYRYVLNRVGNVADAEDITSEVFIRASEGLSSYTITGVPFIVWLVRIARNQVINRFKKQSRHKETRLEVEIASADDPEQTAMQQATAEHVFQAMNKLTEAQQEVLRLRFASGLSVAETAQAMGRSEGAVKFLQHDALRALRRILAPEVEAERYDGK